MAAASRIRQTAGERGGGGTRRRSHELRRGCGVARLTVAAAAVCFAAAVAGAAATPAPARHAARAAVTRGDLPLSLRVATASLRRQLGRRSVVELDPDTRTPRLIAKLDGYLTGRSSERPAQVALRFVRGHPQLFGLRGRAVGTLRLARSWRGSGMTHVVFVQTMRGIRIAGHPLVANVDASGRLINIGGSPLRRLRLNTLRPLVSPRRAVAVATSGRRGAARGAPTLVFVPASTGELRLAWRVITGAPLAAAVSVDAATGRVLERVSLTRSVTASVYRNYPGAPVDGSAVDVDIGPYITEPGAPRLTGPFAYVFTDVNDDGTVGTSEQVPPSAAADYLYARTGFFGVIGAQCPAVGCSWNSNTPFSWQTNLRQQGVNAFYLVNRFHDHLRASPIDFTREKGNFEGEDRVWVDVDVGANSNRTGLPDDDHANNSFMTTSPAGGVPPVAQIDLFLVKPKDNSHTALDAASDPSVVFHEYTHGLTNRLVSDADGVSMLSGPQSRAFDEASADWYSLDYLNQLGYAPDSAAAGDVRLAQYVGLGANVWRTQGLDCAVGAASTGCPGGGGAGGGGYTYGDFGKVGGFPEPHSDGEIWSETLWDLRSRLVAKYGQGGGATKAELLVTRGLELTPARPTFLDARDAILQADTVFNSGNDRALLWQVFAGRGMGYLASARDSADVRPVEDFSVPPAPGSTGTLRGTVTDAAGQPLAHARVWIGGHASGLLESLAGSTDAAGNYTIAGIPAATYPNAYAEAPGGYDIGVAGGVSVAAGETKTLDFALVRDWASAAAGATIAGWTGPDWGPDCGPGQAIDGAPVTAWMSTSPALKDDPGPKSITIKLPYQVNISSFGVDPTTDQDNCATGITSSLGNYKIETSVDGQSFVQAAAGTFTRDDDFRLNAVLPAAGTGDLVSYVRLTGISTQNSAPGFRGAIWMGVAGFEVHGTALLPPPPAHAVTPDDSLPTQVPVPTSAPRLVRCTVPRVVGLQLNVARRRLARNHCRIGRVHRVHARVKKGTVISQSRRARLKLPAGAKVGLGVSAGRSRS